MNKNCKKNKPNKTIVDKCYAEPLKPIKQLLHVTEHGKTTKIQGIPSINVSCLSCQYCIDHSKDKNTICSKCYSKVYETIRTTIPTCLDLNNSRLYQRIISNNEIPLFKNVKYIRFNSFGELHNLIHLQNYINICNINNTCIFALYTKRIDLLHEYFNKLKNKKPDNLNIVVSSLYINNTININFENHLYIDKTFTVYDNNFIKKHDQYINCGSKKCIDCLLCYDKNNEVTFINEKLK